MKTISKLLSFMLLAMVYGSFSACSNTDVAAYSNDFKEEMNVALSADQIAEITFDEFISYVCTTERDSATYKLKSWEVNYGKALYPAKPTVRYSKAESQEAARRIFLGMLATETPVDSSSAAGILTADVGEYGKLTYTPQTTEGELARITVDLKDLPELTEIVLLKPEAWPEDGDPYLGIYNGDVFMRDGFYFVCIKDCSNGDGYLVGFDMSYYDSWLPPVDTHTYKGRDCYHPFWWGQVNANGTDIIRALYQFLYRGGSADPDAVNTIRTIGDKQASSGDALVKALYNDQVFFKLGDDHMWQDAHNWSDKKHTGWHNMRLPYTRMCSNGDIEYRKVRFECDQINEHTCDIYPDGKETKWGHSLTIDRFGVWWKDATVKWNQFLSPEVIIYRNYDAASYNDFLAKQNLSVPNFK